MVRLGKILIVGGGVGGMAAALRLREAGYAVDLVDSDKNWRVYGAGITMTGPSLRAFEQLGVLDEVLEHGNATDCIRICDKDGNRLAKIDLPPPVGSRAPANGGIMRPALHKILSRHVLERGTNVRLGITVKTLQDEGPHVTVTFTDDSVGEYDLVVGADGAFSQMRHMLFPDAPKPKFTGQGCWRILAKRPAAIDYPHFFTGGTPRVGLIPVSPTEMYMFLLQHVPGNPYMPPDQLADLLKAQLAEFGGPLTEVRENIGPDSNIVYRPLEAVLLPAPWHRGRAILIGDAVHATTPHLASGAGMAVEDGLVLGEELANQDDLQTAFANFMRRRFERCRLVVENSIGLGEIEMHGGSQEKHGHLFEECMAVLSAPI